MKKRICSLLAAILLCASPITVLAHEVPDLNRNGTITFVMDFDGEPLGSGSLSLYRVSSIREDDGNYDFQLIEELEGNNVALQNLEDPALAETLAKLVIEKNLTALSAPIRDGEAVFTDVVPGLYVVTQGEKDATDGFAPIRPFLISMPKFENGTYNYTVNADPKVPLETQPPTETQPRPTKPTNPNLPQTGQLNWPVPLLAVAGLILFVAGWLLCFGKKESYEK